MAYCFINPQMGRIYGEPNDFYRYTKYGLKYLLENNGFKTLSIENHGGFFRAIGSHKNFFLSEMYFKNIFLKFIIKKVIIKWNNFFYSKLDDFIKFDKDTLGYNVVAKKVIGG